MSHQNIHDEYHLIFSLQKLLLFYFLLNHTCQGLFFLLIANGSLSLTNRRKDLDLAGIIEFYLAMFLLNYVAH